MPAPACSRFSWDEQKTDNTDYLVYKSNKDIKWYELNNDKLIPLLDYLDANAEYKAFMYQQDIPETILDNYGDFIDWKYVTMYDHKVKLEKYKDKLDWNIIWRYRKFTNTNIKKYADLANWDDISLHQNLNADFIKEYKDKLNWNNLCITHMFSTYYDNGKCELEDYLDYLDERCWINISRYQKLSIKFIDRYADKLNWEALCVFQDISDPLILEKHEKQINWGNVALYQPLNDNMLLHYSNKLVTSDIFKNKNIKLSEQYLFDHFDLIDEFAFASIIEKQTVSMEFLEKFVELHPAIWRMPYRSVDSLLCEYKPANISAISNLSKEFLAKHKDKIVWKDVKFYNLNNCTYGMLFDYRYQLSKDAWDYISRCIELSEEFMDAASDVINWETVSMIQKMSEKFIDEHKDMVDWVYVSVYQKLSEDFVYKHQEYIKWPQYLVTHNKTSLDLIEKCVDYIPLKFVADYIDLPIEFIKKVSKHYAEEKPLVFDMNGYIDKDIERHNNNVKYVKDRIADYETAIKREAEKMKEAIKNGELKKPTAFSKVKEAVSDFILKFRK